MARRTLASLSLCIERTYHVSIQLYIQTLRSRGIAGCRCSHRNLELRSGACQHASPKSTKTVFNCSSGTACLTGNSTGAKTSGVEGTSQSANGVTGTTSATNGDSAVAGWVPGTSGHANGTYGHSSNGPGVYGSSSANAGVYGTSSFGNGIEGHTTAGSGAAGVAGFSTLTGAAGVSGEAADEGFALAGQGDSADTDLLFVFNIRNGGNGCLIDNLANVLCDGTIQGQAVRTRHVNSTGQHVLAYASESASSTIRNIGTARIVAGGANVALDRAFASTIDPSAPYHVFLTPMGDTHGLYVAVQDARWLRGPRGRGRALIRVVRLPHRGAPIGRKKRPIAAGSSDETARARLRP